MRLCGYSGVMSFVRIKKNDKLTLISIRHKHVHIRVHCESSCDEHYK